MTNLDMKMKLAKQLIRYAKWAKEPFDDDDLGDYLEALEHLGWEKCLAGLTRLYQDRVQGRFPNINQIIAASGGVPLNKMATRKHDALSIVENIMGLAARPMALRGTDLKTALGPIGWVIIQRHGGWNALKDRIDNKNQSFIRRELLEAIEHALERADLDLLDVPLSEPLARPANGDLRVVSASDMANQFAHLMPQNVRPLKP